MWYPYQAAEDYNADLEMTYVGEDLSEGVIGEILVGLNTLSLCRTVASATDGVYADRFTASSFRPSGGLQTTKSSRWGSTQGTGNHFANYLAKGYLPHPYSMCNIIGYANPSILVSKPS